MNLKVRPFTRDVRGVATEARIEGNEYVASFYGIPFRVPTLEQGYDRWGSYAIIQETEIGLNDGFVFRIEMDPDPNLPPGCMISFERRDAEEIKALAKANHVDLNSVNILTPLKQVVSVYFNFEGQVDGDAGGR